VAVVAEPEPEDRLQLRHEGSMTPPPDPYKLSPG
jgi:hypothetical protein